MLWGLRIDVLNHYTKVVVDKEIAHDLSCDDLAKETVGFALSLLHAYKML